MCVYGLDILSGQCSDWDDQRSALVPTLMRKYLNVTGTVKLNATELADSAAESRKLN